MAKKQARTKIKRDTTELRGLVILSTALIIFLSVASFPLGKGSHNWLGLVGNGIGYLFHGLFGLGSYFLCLYLGWIGWRLFFKKSLNHLVLKTAYAALFIFSLCMLLSVIEDAYPSLKSLIGNAFYQNIWQRKIRFHLGGAPFFYIYRDLPDYNLARIFNSIGAGLIFT